MANYIELATSIVKSESQIRNENPQTSFPALFRADGYEVVFLAPQGTLSNPVTTRWQEGAPVLTNLGTWQQTWLEVDMYATYTDEQGVLHTKSEQEATAIATLLDTAKAASNAIIIAKLAAADLTIVRAIVEGDTARIAAHNESQTALRAQLQP